MTALAPSADSPLWKSATVKTQLITNEQTHSSRPPVTRPTGVEKNGRAGLSWAGVGLGLLSAMSAIR